MDRKQELLNAVGNDPALLPLIEQIVLMEGKLEKVSRLPFYKVNPQNNTQQKMLPAFRVYKELLQQYTNCIKVIEGKINKQDGKQESPLRKWWKENEKKDMDTGQ